MTIKAIWCEPGESIPKDIFSKLKKCPRDTDNAKYLKDLCSVFGVDPTTLPRLDRDLKLVLGGFIGGEGSFNISAKKSPTGKFGILITPEFSLTQHVNGIGYLLGALELFKVGSFSHKSGSNATLMYKIGGAPTLREVVLPFWKEYISPTQPPLLRQEREKFIKVLDLLLLNKEEAGLDRFLYEILPLWDSLRKQKGQSNESFPNLSSAQDFAREFVKKKKK